MNTFRVRRVKAIVASLVAAGAFGFYVYSFELMQNNGAFLSGWVLLILVLALTFFNARKKLTYPPLVKASTWLQLHVYIGWFSLLVFLLHTQWRLPNGQFESVLYVIFMLLALSGVVGVLLTRIIPKQLAHRGSEVIYERIPMFVRQLREQAEVLIIESVGFNNALTLADFYQKNLESYFSKPSSLFDKVTRRNRRFSVLDDELKTLHRYLSEDERRVADQLSVLMETKDNLDFHYSRQGVLKYWLFFHIPLTYSMLLFTMIHLVLAHAFARGFS